MGNARTALFNALYARGHDGVFLLRIEDTDEARSKDEFTQALMQDLHWLELDWQEGPEVGGSHGPYWQSQRQSIYDEYYLQLQNKGLVYPCFCSEETLALTRKVQMASGQPPRYPGTCLSLSPAMIEERLAAGEKPVLRFHIPKDVTIEFEDLVKGPQVFKSKDIGDFILRRQDGTSPFMYCNAIDDALMGVTHVVRGEDHLTNTPRQILILKALELPIPTYGHISLIMGSDNTPLSKRNGSRNIQQLRDMGFLASALQNYMARLGHYYADNAFLTLDQLAEQFEFKHLNTSPAKYNEEQLMYWQKEAVARLSDAAFADWVRPVIADSVPQEKQTAFLTIIRPQVIFPQDAKEWALRLFAKEGELEDEHLMILQTAGQDFFTQAAEIWSKGPADFKIFTTELQQASGLKGKQLFQPLRVAMTGALHGPEFNHLVELLGNDLIKQRFLHAVELCKMQKV